MRRLGCWMRTLRRRRLSRAAAQVFHVPLEERKYKDMNQFGEGEQAKICLEIMQRTGAHLELSLAKDQGLSIMVSGKLDAVMKARKDIVARLQTQVGGRRHGPCCLRPFPRGPGHGQPGGSSWGLLAFLVESHRCGNSWDTCYSCRRAGE